MLSDLSITKSDQLSGNMTNILMSALNDMLIIYKDHDGHWINANDYAVSFVESLEAKQRDFVEICAEKENEAWHKQSQIRSELNVQMPDDRTVYLDMTFTPVFNEDGSKQSIVIIGRDITEHKNIKKHNEYLQYYDPLTGLPNRRMFEDELAKAIVVARVLQQKITVMVMDLDRFKMINDSLGLDKGNELLKQFSKRLLLIQKQNYIFTRLGDDEFAWIIQNKGLESVQQIAQEIIDTVKEPYNVDQYQLYITASIGICEFPLDGDNVSELYKNASIALGHAKSLGKNRYHIYKNTMNTSAIKSFSLKNDLHKALLMNDIDVFYTPKIDLHTNEVVGTKAIICWEHPEWGFVSHKELCALSDEIGLGIQLCGWFKRKICQQLAKWNRSGLNPVPIAINILTSRVLQNDFIQMIKKVLLETNVDPQFIEIEISETSILEHDETIFDMLHELRELGITLTLDDVGMDSPILTDLKKFPFDNIKIDRNLIQGVGVQELNDFVVKGIIEQANHAKKTVIVEGIDRVEQLHILRESNCDFIQGLRFNKPVTAEEYEEILRVRKIDLPQQEAKANYENMRKFFRINLTYPLAAEMTIIRFKGKDVSLGKTEVLVKDLGLGGIRFASNIQLAVHPDIILRFETEILGEVIVFLGAIVWKKEQKHGIFEYGLEFMIDEKDRDTLAMSLNLLSARIRQNPILPDCRFVTTSTKSFFEKNGQNHHNINFIR